MKLSILREAELESAEAAAWYDDRQAGLGDDFLLEVAQALAEIGDDSQSFSRLESYNGPYEVRRCVLRRFRTWLSLLADRTRHLWWRLLTHDNGHCIGWNDSNSGRRFLRRRATLLRS